MVVVVVVNAVAVVVSVVALVVGVVVVNAVVVSAVVVIVFVVVSFLHVSVSVFTSSGELFHTFIAGWEDAETSVAYSFLTLKSGLNEITERLSSAQPGNSAYIELQYR